MKTNPNDTAFNGPSEYEAERSLTKLEYFAAMAMQGLLANRKRERSDELGFVKEIAIDLESLAMSSVRIADSLIAELNKESTND